MTWNTTTGKLTVDPINRMEGHMGAVCTANWATGANEAAGSVRIVRAELHGNLFRGFENILAGKFTRKTKTRKFGRDPRDAMIFTQRICGVCPIGHGTTSNKNIGNLYGYKIHDEDTGTALPAMSAPLRNLCLAANHLMSHILHFYHLVALDYVDTGLTKPFLCPRYDSKYYINAARVGALAAADAALGNPYAATINALDAACSGSPSTYPVALNSTPAQLAAFINSYLVGQYLKALDMRRVAHEMLAIFGGKGPIVAGYTPGGVTSTIDSTRITAYQNRLNTLAAFIGEPSDFLTATLGTMMFDTVAAAHLFPEYFWIGNSWSNFMAYGWGESDASSGVGLTGDFGTALTSYSNSDNRLSRRGRRKSADPGNAGYAYKKVSPAGAGSDGEIVEAVKWSRYKVTKYKKGGVLQQWLHPWDGKTGPDATGLVNPSGYSWLKSPRYRDTLGSGPELVYEVGPLSRMVVQGLYYAGILNDPGLPAPLTSAYPACPIPGQMGPGLQGSTVPVPPAPGPPNAILTNALGAIYGACYGGQGPDLTPIAYNGDSVLDRIAARTIETRIMVDMAQHELNKLVSNQSGATDPGLAPGLAQGYGMSEASRGALGHWIKTDKFGRIKLYQCVVPTTWNGSPRDANDNPGPAEKSLQGNNADAGCTCGCGLAKDPAPSGQGVWIWNPNEPIEIIRTTHSYDFCIACAVHLVTPDGEEKTVVVPPLP